MLNRLLICFKPYCLRPHRLAIFIKVMNTQSIQNNRLTLLALSIFLVMPIFVSAAPGAGIKPSSYFYFMDLATERISLFFTFNEEKKTQKALGYAEERIAEIEAVGLSNEPIAVEKAVEQYEKNITLATNNAQLLKDADKKEKLLTIVSENTSKHQEKLAEVYNKVNDEAKKAVEKAIEVSSKWEKQALNQIAELKSEIRDLKNRISELEEKTQSDKDKELEILRKEVEKLKTSAVPQQVIIENPKPKVIQPPVINPTNKLNNKEIILKVKPAVVYIETTEGSGSGIVISDDGWVLTNAHVVSGVSTARVKLSSNQLFIGKVAGRDEYVDLAIIKINSTGLSAVELGNSDTVEQGDEVFTLGYPFGLEGDVSFKEGTVSRRQTIEGETYIETSAEIHPGNSGGPLVNRFGQVIGINTGAFGKSIKGIILGETIKVAIPINTARNYIPELKAGRNIVEPTPFVSQEPVPTPLPFPSPMPAPSSKLSVDEKQLTILLLDQVIALNEQAVALAKINYYSSIDLLHQIYSQNQALLLQVEKLVSDEDAITVTKQLYRSYDDIRYAETTDFIDSIWQNLNVTNNLVKTLRSYVMEH